MKKIFLLLSLLISAVVCFSQTYPVVPRSNSSVTVQDSRWQAQYNLFTPRYADTTAANVQRGNDSCSAVIFTYDVMSLWVRACSPKRWVMIGTALVVDTTNTVLLSGAGTILSPLAANAIISPQSGNSIVSLPNGIYSPVNVQNGLISGGRVIWETGLTYTITAATYAINGVIYNSPETSVTLANADVTFGRIDGFIVTTSSTATTLTGTPSDDPQNPSYTPSTQLPLTFTLVTANMTEPVFCRDSIYYPNNGEMWTGSVSNAGRINLTSTNNTYSVTQDIEFTLAQNGDQLRLTKATVVNLGTYSVLVLKIRSKATWAATSRILIQFYNGLTPLGISVALGEGTFGFNTSITNAYQTIVIPLPNFGSVTSPDNILFTISTISNNTIGLYADNIELLGCEGTPVPVSGAFWQVGGNLQATALVGGTRDNYPTQMVVNNTNHTIFNTNGTIGLQGTNPGVSFFLNSFLAADYFIRRVANTLTLNVASAAIIDHTIAGNSMYSLSAANGHLFNSSAASNLMQLTNATGALRLFNYGDNTFTGTATRWLAVDVNGNVIEESPPLTAVTASNGLTATANNVVLGGTALSGNTSIPTSAFSLTLNSSNATQTLKVNNTAGASGIGIYAVGDGFGYAMFAEGTGDANGIAGTSINANGGVFQSTNQAAIYAESNAVTAGQFISNVNASTGDYPVISVQRSNISGAGANGIGGMIQFITETTTQVQNSNQIISRWTNATNATRTSQFVVTGVNSATTVDILAIAGDGSITVGAAYQGLGAGYLAVSNTGQLTWSAGGGGGGGDALTSNPLSQFAATTSAQLAGVISDETGSGALVFANSPVFTTPNIGTATGSITGNAATATALQTGRTINGTTFDGTTNITVTAAAGTLTGTTLNSTVVTSSLTAVGTIATGVWNATAIGITKGGTGLTTLGTAGQFLRVNAGATGYEFATVSGSGTVTSVGLIGPAVGITVSGSPITTAGSFTLTLNGDLAAVEGIGTTGFVQRTAANTWSTVATINGATQLSGVIPFANGGLGTNTVSTGQIFFGGAGNTITKGTITGATNRINATFTGGNYLISHVFNPTEQVLTDAATTTWNVTNGGNAVWTNNGTGRTLTLSNVIAGYSYTLRLIQGSGGSKTVTTWTNVRWANGTLPTLATTAGSTDMITLYAITTTSFVGYFTPNVQ